MPFEGKAYCDPCLRKAQDRVNAQKNFEREEHLRTIRSIIVASTPSLQGFTVTQYLGFDGVEVTVGTGWLSEVVTEVVDIVGARSKMFENKLSRGRRSATTMLQQLAHQKGANAVIGVDVDYSTFSGNRTAIIMTGTFVVVEAITPG